MGKKVEYVCPLCGAEMSVKESPKKVLFLVCKQYPDQHIATPAMLNAMTTAREDNARLSERLDEARGAVVRMMDAYADAKGDAPKEPVGCPVRLGDYIDYVAKVAIERSKRKRARGR